MLKLIKDILQVFILSLIIQIPVLSEIRWGTIDDTFLGKSLHILAWLLSYLVLFVSLYRMNASQRDSSSKKVNYSYVKIVGLVVGTIIVKLLILNIFPDRGGYNGGDKTFSDILSQFGWMTLLSVNILSPILEEVVFRGILQERLKQVVTPKLGILITGIVFAMLHSYSLTVSFFMALVSGLVFSWLYFKTNSIIYPIIAHILMNILVTILQFISRMG
ncbi:CPBP family intramembrane metalloprotease [Streptococcus suis]|nr:CPBP family intramembrane metalloprotease [Streptococcus suis]